MADTERVVLDVKSPEQWEQWLEVNHDTATEVWLRLFNKSAGEVPLSYAEAVEIALCFGWIDSLIKRVDDNRYAIKVTPRKPTSRWSAINRTRWTRLEAAGLLAAPGLAAAPTDNSYAPRPQIPALPAYIARAFKANAKVWQNFRALAPTYRRHFVVWIDTAKRPETRERRIREAIALLAAGKKLGLK